MLHTFLNIYLKIRKLSGLPYSLITLMFVEIDQCACLNKHLQLLLIFFFFKAKDKIVKIDQHYQLA